MPQPGGSTRIKASRPAARDVPRPPGRELSGLDELALRGAETPVHLDRLTVVDDDVRHRHAEALLRAVHEVVRKPVRSEPLGMLTR